MQVGLTLKSTNRKTGPIPVSTTSRETCPTNCPWYNTGCYGLGGPLRIHWSKVNREQRGTSFTYFLRLIRNLPDNQLWRHNQVGDLPGKSRAINKRDLFRLVAASRGKKGFTYTHKEVLGKNITAKINRELIKEANNSSFTINLSADGLEHADQLLKLKIAPVTVTLPSAFQGRSFRTPGGTKGIICPAVTREGTTCATCGLCAIWDRPYLIGFPSHGAQKGSIDTKLLAHAKSKSNTD